MGSEVVIVGGGPAGLESAGRLAGEGIKVTVIEKNNNTGGHVNDWYHLFPDGRDSMEVSAYLINISENENVRIIPGTSAENIKERNNSLLVYTSDGKQLKADAVIVATGFDLFRSERKEEYGYGIYDNVVSSADLEKMFRENQIVRHDGEVPGRIGFIHCVGSRDEKAGNIYCSKLCCITAVKQAIELKKKLSGANIYCFYMDMRMGGAHYEEIYKESQEKYGINYIRGKVSEISENHSGRLIIKAEDTLVGRPLRMELDMVVLMAGMEMSEGGRRIAENAGLLTGENRFFAVADNHFGSNLSNMKGVFYAGCCTAPLNLTETISHARSAAVEVLEFLKNKKS